ncbi:MAG: hypothetical protein KAW41_06705 [Candidatus Diapherotrites archaeon]|nr:hypothetical protein [Candidatus Diapherotrites archaeon]
MKINWRPNKTRLLLVAAMLLVVFAGPMLLRPTEPQCQRSFYEKNPACDEAFAEYSEAYFAYQAVEEAYSFVTFPLYAPPSLLMAVGIVIFAGAIHGDVLSILGFWAWSLFWFTTYFYLLAMLLEAVWKRVRE